MTVFIRKALIFDTISPFHGQLKNVLIEQGIIKRITDENLTADHIIEAEGN